MGKVNNALKMLAILRSRNKVTRKELAQELEVGIREISRYKDDLESAGVYITNIKGKYGGYILENKDYLLNLELSKEEELSLEYVQEYTKDKKRNAIFELIDEGKKLLDEKYSPDGYNVGINCGEVAGQTVMHVHVHLIPRYNGDTHCPKGGVRGVIPDKMKY